MLDSVAVIDTIVHLEGAPYQMRASIFQALSPDIHDRDSTPLTNEMIPTSTPNATFNWSCQF